jgi:hypothetical protein
MDRPFKDDYWPQLAAKADEAWEDPTILQLILAELLFRRRAGAQRLRKKVAERLTEMSQRFFHWPSTAVLPSSRALAGDQFWYSEGLLSFMGYRVGHNGVPASHRRDILDYIYHETVPRVHSAEYMRSWGIPKSRDRLKKMADSIAAFTRNARRNLFADMSAAIDDWEADLVYLKRTYYDRKYDFRWPPTHDNVV